jgi:hypothetical protein
MALVFLETVFAEETVAEDFSIRLTASFGRAPGLFKNKLLLTSRLDRIMAVFISKGLAGNHWVNDVKILFIF